MHSFLRPKGFTLIELMITIVIAGILASLALPSFRTFILSQRIRSCSFDFAASMMLARSEAIKINALVNIVPAGSNWANGWCIYVASNTIDCALGTGTIIQRHEAITGVSITGAPTTISYSRNGRLVSTSSAFNTKIAAQQTGLPVTARCISTDSTGFPVSKSISGSGTCP